MNQPAIEFRLSGSSKPIVKIGDIPDSFESLDCEPLDCEESETEEKITYELMKELEQRIKRLENLIFSFKHIVRCNVCDVSGTEKKLNKCSTCHKFYCDKCIGGNVSFDAEDKFCKECWEGLVILK
jgi:hypothetical protein